MRIHTILLTALLPICAASVSAETTAIIGGTVIDGNGGAPLQDGVIVIDGERIVSVGRRGTAIPAKARRIDAKGKYIIPGLMDANVHLVYGFSTDFLIRFESQFEDIIRESAQVALKSGVTTVFDTWGPMQQLQTVRNEINAGKVEGSRIFLAGNIVGLNGPFSTDFYASTQSVGKKTVQRVNEMYERGTSHSLTFLSPEHLRDAIRKYLANDIDFLKYAVNGHGPGNGGFILFSPGAQQIIVDETRRKGLTVQSHTMSVEGLRMAVETRVDLMQHCTSTGGEAIPDELLQEIVERRIPCGLGIFPRRYLEHTLGANLAADPASITDPGQRTQVMNGRNQKRLIDAGGTILMATDGGVGWVDCPLLHDVFFQHAYPEIAEDIVGFFGHGHSAWMRGATEAGLDPMKALQAATRNVAAAYKKLDDFGTLEAGKVADLVVLNGNPLTDAASYTKIGLVMKAGKVVNHQALPTVKVITALN